ncbi:MAG TPA: M1 family aminopeptidase [Bacteroidota bacterium]|nr:M1 family aminopeptidase [Bacteroidota bacterium]
MRVIHLLSVTLVIVGNARAQYAFDVDTTVRRSRTYDVIHYKIVVDLNDTRKRVSGTTLVKLTPLTERLDSVVLDAVDMDVRRVVREPQVTCRFTSRPPKLVVYLNPPATPADTLTLAITYSCTPKKGLYFTQPDSTNPTRRRQIWTQGEDVDNSSWFPCYDFPNDMATSEVVATVPTFYTLLSNGTLVSETVDTSRLTRTFHWRQAKPHVSYLVMIAASDFAIVRDTAGNVPLEYYLYKDRVEDGLRSFARTPDIMAYFQTIIGVPYPWEKFAQVLAADFVTGAMENTSAVTYNDQIYLLDQRAMIDFTTDDVVAHELAHQWWGDVVTCRDWTHLWLNEGFATYFEALFKWHDRGADVFQLEKFQETQTIRNTERSLGRRPIVSKESYTNNVYAKGGWVLYMLHHILGEEAFWKGVRLYLDRYTHRNAETNEFALAIEDATGRNMDWFFRQWVYRAGHPHLTVTQTWDSTSFTHRLVIDQVQPLDSLTGIFRFPLNIEYTTSVGAIDTMLWVTRQHTEITRHLPTQPEMVIVDRGYKLLKTITFGKSVEENLYQLAHAKDVADRITAARDLRSPKNNPGVFEGLRYSAQQDPFWAVRQEATISLGVMTGENVRSALIDLVRDVNSRVRQAAVVALERFPSPEVKVLLDSVARCDSSYLVVGSCVTAMKEVDSVYAFDMAARYVAMESYRNIVRRAALGVLRELDDPRALPITLKYARPGQSADIRRLAVAIVGNLGRRDQEARSMMAALVDDWDPSVRRAAVAKLSEWGGDEAREIIRKRKWVEEETSVVRAIDEALEHLSD